MRRSAATVVASLLLVGLAAGCGEDPGPPVRDHYATLEDCVADWGRAEQCERIQSSGYSGGKIVYRGPAYPQNAREAARRDAIADALSDGATAPADPARQGRSIGTVMDPVARDGAPARGNPELPPTPRNAVSTTVLESLAGLPYFVAFFGIALMMLTLALAGFIGVAARRDMGLIRDGNVAVAAGMTGVLIGFALPLASVLIATGTLLDLLVWAGVALLAQLLVLAGVRLALGALAQRMRDGQVASGVFLGAVAVVLGMLNAASIVIGL